MNFNHTKTLSIPYSSSWKQRESRSDRARFGLHEKQSSWRGTCRIIPCVLLAAALATPANAQLASFGFDGGVQTPDFKHSQVDVTSFTINVGTVSFPAGTAPTPGDSISANGWNGAAGTKRWEFTVTPAEGSLLNLSSFQFDDQRSASGPASWSVSINGIEAASAFPTHSEFSDNPMNMVDLSGGSFQGLESAVVSLYGFDAPGASGTWRIDNVALHGGVSPVPEPSQYALLFSGTLVGFAVYRRRKGTQTNRGTARAMMQA
jgi:hypothetical protein